MTAEVSHHRLVDGPTTATVSTRGAALVALHSHGRALVVGGEGGPRDRLPFAGVVVAPWPNRVADGRYRFAGRTHQLPCTEPDRRNALHGLVAEANWEVVELDPTHISLQHHLAPTAGYPFALDLIMEYVLEDRELTCRLHATNVGTDPAPYGCTIHPHLSVGTGGVDDWTLRLAADTWLAVDEQRLLPIRRRAVDGSAFDLRDPAPLAGRVFDHALTDLVPDGDGLHRAVLADATGHGVTMTWGPECPWVQLYTADVPGHAADRRAVAIEPMTCPPDAFNSGVDLVRLEPAASHVTTWAIAAAEIGP